MADPLTQTVEQFAPAPLNIFDQDQAETIISKYSGARRELEDATTAFEANRAVQQAEQDKYRTEQDRIRAERDKLLSTREDEIYNQRKEGENMRSQFIGEMYDTLRPKEEGYDERMVTFFREVPESVQNDEVFREILKGYTAVSEKAEEQRRQDREMETRQKNTLEAIQARAKTNTFLSNLKPEDYTAAPKDENGNPSLEYLYSKAAERKMENEINQLKEKERIKTLSQKQLIEARGASKQLRDEAKQVEDVLINDKTAFPDRAAMVRQQYKDNPATLGYGTGKDTLEEAEAWDKNKFDNEIIAARGYDNPEDYVNKITNLNVDQRQNRYRLWQHANTYGGKVPPRVSEGAVPLGGANVEDIRTADGKAAPAGSKAIPLGGAPAPAPALTAPTDGDLSKLIDQWKEKRAQARSDRDVSYEIDINDKEYVKISDAPDGSTYLVYRGGEKNRGTHRLDGPAWVQRNAKGEIIDKAYFIEDDSMPEEDYWKDPRVIEYAKTKGTAAPAPAPAAPKYTAEQLLKVAPAGSKIVTLPDGTLRIVTPDGKTLRPK